MLRSHVLRVGAGVAALGLLLVACADDGDDARDDPREGREAALISAGQLTVCSDAPYPPFTFEDDDEPGGSSGFDIDLVHEIAERLDLELQVRQVGFDDLQSGAALAAGRCDLAASAMTITDERAERLTFSDPYYDVQQSLIVLVEADISSLEDVADRALGVQDQTPGVDVAAEHAPSSTEIVELDQAPDIYTGMLAGRIVAGLHELPANLERADTDDRFEVVETFVTGEQYGFAVALGNDALIDAVDAQLAAMRDDGTYREIHDDYFAID